MAHCPDRGEIVWLSLDPQAGHEQAGRRPALAISPLAYNKKVGLALFCPITNHIKGYPFEVELPPGQPVSGAVLCDQLKSLDWNARDSALIGRLPKELMEEVLGKVRTLI